MRPAERKYTCEKMVTCRRALTLTLSRRDGDEEADETYTRSNGEPASIRPHPNPLPEGEGTEKTSWHFDSTN